MPERVVFMGTPQFAVPSLERLVDQGYRIVGAYTQPDRPAGRSGAPARSPLKRAAERLGLPVYQPRSLRRPEEQERLRGLAPDLIVVAAYGLILPQAVLDIPRHGGLNVHPSLLPRHRGASPITGALLAGETETGVSIMLMDAGLDTGPVLTQRRVAVGLGETAGDLTARLAVIGAHVLVETIPRWVSGAITPAPQDDTQATYTRMLTKEDSQIDWSLPAEEIARRIRAYAPWPGTATTWQGKRLEVLEGEPVAGASGEPGTVFYLDKDAAVSTGDGALLLKRVQLEGRKALDVEEFLRGARGLIGSRLGGV